MKSVMPSTTNGLIPFFFRSSYNSFNTSYTASSIGIFRIPALVFGGPALNSNVYGARFPLRKYVML